MASIGQYLKTRFPVFYFPLVRLLNKLISASRPYSIYVTDGLGGSFKDYFLEQDMPTRITQLKASLDQESVQLIDVLLKRLIHYPDERHQFAIAKKKSVIGGLLPLEQQSSKGLIRKQLKDTGRIVKLPSALMEESVFYFYHGLVLLPQRVVDRLKDQHFIDIGAYVGDSAIALHRYHYSKIFSLEISQKSAKKYSENLRRCNIPSDKFAILNIGVAANDSEPTIEIFDTGSAGFSPFRRTGKYDKIEVHRKSLDSIVDQYSIEPKFIKVDIEGAAMDFVLGAQKTLTRFRPVLSVAIYHNPIEFFEVKPALERLLVDYIFLVRKLSSEIKFNQIHSEVVLLAYPKELLE